MPSHGPAGSTVYKLQKQIPGSLNSVCWGQEGDAGVRVPHPMRTTQNKCASRLLESAQKAQSTCRVRLQPSSSWMRPALEPAPAVRRPAKANSAAPARHSLCLLFLSSTFIFNLRPATASTRSPSPPGPCYTVSAAATAAAAA